MIYFCGCRRCWGHSSAHGTCEIMNKFETMEKGVRKKIKEVFDVLIRDGIVIKEQAEKNYIELYDKFLPLLKRTQKKHIKKIKLSEEIKLEVEVLLKETKLLAKNDKLYLDIVIFLCIASLESVYRSFQKFKINSIKKDQVYVNKLVLYILRE